ncbi:hypothetical protein IT774_13240 [Salinimonas marina]|uniref:Uncharacterized protein n=1 Tax=Salinimonas marina TaxID=2785918 RepID=A0A7S9DWE7_9ALTE|nr:hypothetical protein [Salinimonas marina]QPG05087.1 hypothetical protein IT774_13240 [Salinimonas marina]
MTRFWYEPFLHHFVTEPLGVLADISQAQPVPLPPATVTPLKSLPDGMILQDFSLK